MDEGLLWMQITKEVEQLLKNSQADDESIEDAICLLLLKLKWRKNINQSMLSNQLESQIIDQIEHLMQKDKSGFEDVLVKLNRSFY